MIKYHKKYKELVEDCYQIKEEAQHATLFTTGNGYFGVRGSFEEFGPVNVQGSYVRGLIDEIIEIPQLFVDNIYMRKYYFDELKSKTFEYQDSCINYCDFLFVRFVIGDQEFYPWEGKIIEWIRYLDTNDGSLVREVIWDDGFGHLSKISFRRFASFSNNHYYLMKCSLERLNHQLPCKILSGIDTFVKTNGQKKSKLKYKNLNKEYSQYLFNIGNLYNYDVCVNVANKFINCRYLGQEYRDGLYYDFAESLDQNIVSLEKYIYVSGTMDYHTPVDLMEIGETELLKMVESGYHVLYNNHCKEYQKVFDMINIKITGNDPDDALLRYSNFQTIIAIDRFDTVHSLSAKNLTSEKYNQFVWWDAEIFQLPIYLAVCPEAAKKCLIYRYQRLEESKNNARKEGYQGAKFAFCSSVKGDEKVWEYARHPFLQIHINSDVAYGVLNYYQATLDRPFMLDYGFELLIEISRYWVSRVQYNETQSRNEILNVTGTDEHHPYVDNNAYTNYLTAHILNETARLLLEFGDYSKLHITKAEIELFNEVGSKIYLPLTNTSLIPQFDGYFNLSKTLEIDGNGVGKGFQMKDSGLYHLSQVIKQPDVMMLFSYVNLPNVQADYRANWQYYEPMCEKSSSLSYPVHAICAIDNEQYEKFYQYWQEAMRIDIDDLHQGAHQGLHAGCMAGGYYAIYRGLLGIKALENHLEVNPKRLQFGDKLEMKFYYHNNLYQAILTKEQFVLLSSTKINICYQGEIIVHDGKTEINLN